MEDFEVTFGGSVIGLAPKTGEAQEWVEENVALESWQWLGGAFFGDARMMHELVDVIAAEGFTFDTGEGN
jgi:hypothetical protein